MTAETKDYVARVKLNLIGDLMNCMECWFDDSCFKNAIYELVKDESYSEISYRIEKAIDELNSIAGKIGELKDALELNSVLLRQARKEFVLELLDERLETETDAYERNQLEHRRAEISADDWSQLESWAKARKFNEFLK